MRFWSLPSMRISMFVLSTILFLYCSCKKSSPPHPKGVPLSAVWVGGADGGVFINCQSSSQNSGYRCTIFNDATGDIVMSGFFERKSNRSGEVKPEYSSYDGQRIFLQDGDSMAPVSSTHSANVPSSAVLAENGVWVDCFSISGKQYKCSLYLAATSTKLSAGMYQLEESDSVGSILNPKIATQEIIYLKGGAILRAIENRDRQ
jgi:hypothetical protein